MRLAVASGKGGTGKTTVATNLAFVAAQRGRRVAYLDCDVEEPNGAIFLKPDLADDRPVGSAVPKVDLDKCIDCGKCGEICQYSAIVSMDGTVLTFPELCHGCAGCWLVCPAGAIVEDERPIGRLQSGSVPPPAAGAANAAEAGGASEMGEAADQGSAPGEIGFVQGLLDIGQAMSPPLIRAVKAAEPPAELTIVDCPPGTSCPVIEAIKGADYVLLVTEPTPFGLHDLKLAVETVRQLKLPFGVLINRADSGDDETARFCRTARVEVLAEIPDVRGVAEAYSRGLLAAEASEHARAGFERLLDRLDAEATA